MLVMSGMVVRFSDMETPLSPEKFGKGGSSDGIFRDAELGPATINRQEKHPLWPRAPLTSGSAVFHDPEPQSPSALVSSFFLLLRFCTCFVLSLLHFCEEGATSACQLARQHEPRQQTADVGRVCLDRPLDAGTCHTR